MKRVLIAFDWLHMGGTEKFIIDAINLLPSEEYRVDLFLIHEEGPYLKYLPANVRLVCPFKMSRQEFDGRYAESYTSRSGRAYLKQKKFFKAAFWTIANKFNRDSFKRFEPLLNEINTDIKYDIAIGASMTRMFPTAVAALVNAEKKYLWVHMPFRKKRSDNYVYFNARQSEKYVEKFDGIVCVSNGIESMVRSAMPDYKGFVATIYNYLDKEKIREKANEPIDERLDGEVKIVSVGRVETQKGFDMAIDAAKILKDKGQRFVWYIVGDGKYRSELTAQAKKLGLSDCFIFLGRRDNPYPYMQMCDIYCQPSRFEACCTTVNEAMVLGKPVVATNFTGIDEQVADGINGLIVQKNAQSIAVGLKKLFDAKLRSSFEKNIDYPTVYKSGKMLDSDYLENLNKLADSNINKYKE